MSTEVVPAPAAQRLRRRSTTSSRGHGDVLLPLACLALTVGILEVLTRSGVVERSVLPPPSDVARELWTTVVDGTAPGLAAKTLQGWFVGLAAALAIGTVLGIVLGTFSIVELALRGVLEAIRPIPSVAVIPLLVIMLGIGMEMKYVLVLLAALWPITIHATLGVRSVDAVAKDTMRTYSVPLRGRLAHLVLPSLAPQVLTGLRVASAIGLIVAVTAELIVGAPGLGNQVNLAQQSGRVEQMWAYIVLIGIIGTAANAAMLGLERRVLHWHASHRRAIA